MKNFKLNFTIAFLAVQAVLGMRYMFEKELAEQRNSWFHTTKITVSGIEITSIDVDCLVKNFPNLYFLEISRTGITEISSDICKLKNLEKLYLHNNGLTKLPGKISDLTSLKELNLSNNNLTSLPSRIGKLKNLEKLGLDNNGLTYLPAEFCDLTSLDSLDLSNNKLTFLHYGIGKLKNLEKLYLHNNGLTELPRKICNLTSLKFLSLSNNNLTSLPTGIEKLKHLEKLYLHNNGLTELPRKICNLTSLDLLNLSNNKLTSLPSGIGKLTNLVYLNASSNHFESIPASIRKLKQKLVVLNLSNNFKVLSEVGDDLNYGLAELRQIFGDYLVYSYQFYGEFEIISLEDAKSKINSQFPHWNLDKLKGLIVKTLAPQHISSYAELLEIWNSKIKPSILFEDLNTKTSLVDVRHTEERIERPMQPFPVGIWIYLKDSIFNTIAPRHSLLYGGLLSIWNIAAKPFIYFLDLNNKIFSDDEKELNDNITLLENYIRHLHDSEFEYKGWKMEKQYVEQTKNYIEAILKEMQSKINESHSKIETSRLLKSCLQLIAEGIQKCPDGQISGMQTVYYGLLKNEKLPENNLDSFTDMFIAREKLAIFSKTMISSGVEQNVHVLNHWLYELREELGFDFDLKFTIGTMGQDKYRNQKGNALMGFYDNFSPDLIAKRLAEVINENNRICNDALGMISISDDIDESIKDKMFICEEEAEHHIHNDARITAEFAKYYLIYRKLLIDDPLATKVEFAKPVIKEANKEANFVSIDTFLAHSTTEKSIAE